MKNQKLFDYMHQEHKVTLLESDMIEIRNIVLEAIKDEEEQSEFSVILKEIARAG